MKLTTNDNQSLYEFVITHRLDSKTINVIKGIVDVLDLQDTDKKVKDLRAAILSEGFFKFKGVGEKTARVIARLLDINPPITAQERQSAAIIETLVLKGEDRVTAKRVVDTMIAEGYRFKKLRSR